MVVVPMVIEDAYGESPPPTGLSEAPQGHAKLSDQAFPESVWKAFGAHAEEDSAYVAEIFPPLDGNSSGAVARSLDGNSSGAIAFAFARSLDGNSSGAVARL
eukprot:2964928-Pyramimonas_sp.AAC.1